MNDLIKTKSTRLTPKQKRVFKYIFNNLDDCIFLTASALGKKTGVSEATVVRLAQSLGFEGFPDFKRRLRSHFQDRVTTISRLEDRLRDQKHSPSVLDILNREMKNISLLAGQNAAEKFEAAVEWLWKAPKIVIVGLRSAYGLAVYMKFGLRFLGKDVMLLDPAQWDLWDQLTPLGKDTLMVGISFPRYARMTIDAVAFARERRCRILAITDSLVSPLTTYSDWVLVAPCQSYSYMDSFTAAMALIHTLLTTMSLKEPAKALEAFKKLEEVWDREGVYYSPSRENPPLP